VASSANFPAVGFDLAGFADRVRQVVTTECARFRLPVPRLTVEPGRAIVNRAMITLYRVVTVTLTARRCRTC
jgi:diaminopimelate decarboxylase